MWEIKQGDCLEILKTLKNESADLCIADPPYMLGAISAGDKKSKSGTWADIENIAYWYSAWMKEIQRVLNPKGYMCVFGNWRSLPTYIRALSLCNWKAQSCIVWDKEWIAPAGPAQVRPRYELIIIASNPGATVVNRKVPDIWNYKWQASHSAKYGHPAEKPVELMLNLITTFSPNGETIIDPFAGSSSAGEAAILLGKNYIGIEREEKWVKVSNKRLESIKRMQ